MKSIPKNTKDRLVEKSIEAFIMALEIFNKPTLTYRVEGFSFFICNAWELMLKAHIINEEGEEAIYYPGKPNRTISLRDAISKIYTDVKQPLRINLEEIIKLRDESTHFVTEDHESLYTPFFQSCVFNFSEQIKKFHNVDITDYVSQNFLVLSVNVSILTNEEIEAKYSKEMAQKFIAKRNELNELRNQYSSNDLYIPLRVEFYQTKKRDEADIIYSIDKSGDESVQVITREIRPENKFNLTRKNVISGVNKQLTSRGIKFNYISSKGENKFNDYTLRIIAKHFNLYEKYSYTFGHSTRYSQQLVEEIVNLINQNPNIISDILKRNGEKQKITPGS